MHITGIVAEYNPFHTGHKYHIETAKKETQADGIVAIMMIPNICLLQVMEKTELVQNFLPQLQSQKLLEQGREIAQKRIQEMENNLKYIEYFMPILRQKTLWRTNNNENHRS